MKTFVIVSAILVVTVFAIIVIESREKPKAGETVGDVKPTLTIDHDGPGGWKLRFKSVMPKYITCTNFDLSGSFSVSLNAAGEAYFGSYKDDVNAAIAAAVSDAVAEFPDKSGKYCQDECQAMLSTVYDATSNDASATAQIVLTQGVDTPEQTELCWPLGDPPDTGIHITASAPGLPGWNISSLFAGMSSSSFIESLPDDPAAMANVIAYALSDSVAGVVVGGTTTWIISSGGSSGDVQIAMQRVSATSVNISVDGPFLSASTYFASYTTSADVASSTGTITFGLASASTATHGWPSSFTGTWGKRPDLSIDQNIHLDNTGGETDTHTPSVDTASLTASGSMTIALSPAIPKVGDLCQIDYTFSNEDDIQRLCDNVLYVVTKGVPYIFPIKSPPHCKITVRVPADA